MPAWPKLSLDAYLENPEAVLDEQVDWYFLRRKYPVEEGEDFPTEKARHLDYVQRGPEIRRKIRRGLESRLKKRDKAAQAFHEKYKQHLMRGMDIVSQRLNQLNAEQGRFLNEFTISINEEERSGHISPEKSVELKKQLLETLRKQ